MASKEASRYFLHLVERSNDKTDLTSRVIAEDVVDPLKVQRELAEAWASLLPGYPKENIHIHPSIEHATKFVRSLTNQNTGGEHGSNAVDILVAGSLHLVGGVIEVAGLSPFAL